MARYFHQHFQPPQEGLQTASWICTCVIVTGCHFLFVFPDAAGSGVLARDLILFYLALGGSVLQLLPAGYTTPSAMGVKCGGCFF